MKEKNNKEKNLKDNSLFSYYSFSEKDAKKYPVVSKILKQLTPERIKKEIEAIQEVKVIHNFALDRQGVCDVVFYIAESKKGGKTEERFRRKIKM